METSNNSITISDEVKTYLLETAKWMKFLSIVGFVCMGLMAMGGLALLVLGATFRLPGLGSSAVLGAIYLACAVIYFFPILYLFKAAVGIKQGVSGSADALTVGFLNLKSHYKFAGIMIIVVLSLYVLLFIVGIIVFAATMVG